MNQAAQYVSVPHPSMQANTMNNMMQLATNPNHLSTGKLGPVERAVLTQVLGDSRPHKRKAQLRCETCSVSFNSQGQADTHYRGKRHARITEIRRRKSQKASIEQEQAAGKNQAAGEDSEGINTTTESGNSSEEQNEMDKLQKSENEEKNQETR